MVFELQKEVVPSYQKRFMNLRKVIGFCKLDTIGIGGRSARFFFVPFVDYASINETLPIQLAMAAKIDQQAHFQAGGFQIIEQLRFFRS